MSKRKPEVSITIKKENLDRAIDDLKSMMDALQSGSKFKGQYMPHHYVWVNTEKVLRLCAEKDLRGILDEWGYELSEDSELYSLDSRARWRRKWGDDEQLWKALAPVIEEGGYINWRGEDECYGRYEFSGGTLRELHGEIVWK